MWLSCPESWYNYKRCEYISPKTGHEGVITLNGELFVADLKSKEKEFFLS